MKKLILAALLTTVPGLAAAQSMTGRQYVRMAGASDQYEIQSSRLVLQTTRNPALRRFASEMVRDHNKSTADVKRAAMQGRIMAGPPHLDAMGARNIAQLRRARGVARDALYIQQQKVSHQQGAGAATGICEQRRRPSADARRGQHRAGGSAPYRRVGRDVARGAYRQHY